MCEEHKSNATVVASSEAQLAVRLADKSDEVVDILQQLSEVSATIPNSTASGEETYSCDSCGPAFGAQDGPFCEQLDTSQFCIANCTKPSLPSDSDRDYNTTSSSSSLSSLSNDDDRDVYLDCNNDSNKHDPLQTCKNVIIILGHILSRDGSPHEWMLQRVLQSVKLLSERKLKLSDTVFIPSGGAVSNEKYRLIDSNGVGPHPTEALTMRNLLIEQHKIPSEQIVCEPQARTTLENICFCFELLHKRGMRNLENLFVVTSDWHAERVKLNFGLLYEMERELESKMEGNVLTKRYEIRRWFETDQKHSDDDAAPSAQVHVNIDFIGAKSGAPRKRFKREVELRNAPWVQPQAMQYRELIWKWRDEWDASQNSKMEMNAKAPEVMEAFAFSTAIEHLYLRLEGAKNGLDIKQVENKDCQCEA